MHVLLRGLDKLAQLVLYLFALTAIVLAIMTSLLRYYLPKIDHYREPLLALVSEKTEWQVDTNLVNARWRQFRPSFELYDLHLIHNKTGHQVTLDYLQVEINIAKSLYQQKLYLESVTLDGMEVVLLQNEQGKWAVSSNKQTKRSLALDELLDHLWSISSFNLQDLSLTMVPYQQQAIHFPQLHAKLSSWLNNKIVQIDINEGQTNRSHLIVEASNHFKDADFQADVYWQTSDFPLHLLLPLLGDITVHSESRISQEVWLSWRDGFPSGVGDFNLDGLTIDYQGKPWVAESGQGSFYLDVNQQGLSFGVPSLSFTLNDQAIRFDKLKYQQIDQRKLVQVETIDLTEINRYLQLIKLPDRLQELRDDLQARGELRNLSLEIFDDDIFFQANLNDVSVGAWSGAPALEHVSGYIEASKLSGFVELDTPELIMAFPQLYDSNMQFKESLGTVYWHVAESVKVGSLGQISLDGLYGQAVGEFELDIPIGAKPNDPNNVGRMSLVVDLKNADARFRNDLIPATLNEKLLDWLDVSIIEAWIRHGSFIYHGPIAEHAEEEKLVQLWLDVDQAAIQFHSDFPVVYEITGQFLLDHLSANASIARAKSADMELNDTQLDLSVDGNSPFVEVSSKLNEASSRVLSYLQQDFISQASAGALDNWRTDKGRVNARLNVYVPLSDPGKTQVKVDAQLSDVSLDLVQPALLFEQVSGDLSYDTSHGFSATKLHGKLWGEPLQASIRNQQGTNQLSFDYSSVHIDSLKNWLGLSLLDFFTGQTAVQGELNWGGKQASLSLHSLLTGIKVDLPEPFAKLEQEQVSFELFLPLKERVSDMSLSLDAKHQVYLRLDQGELLAGNIALNSAGHQGFEAGVINVYGSLEQAKVEQWIDSVEKFRAISHREGAKQLALGYRVQDLSIGVVDLWSYPVERVKFSAEEQNQSWRLRFVTDYFDGQLAIPANDTGTMQLQFHELDLAFLQSSSLGKGEQESLLVKEVNFNPIQVGVDQLLFEEQQLGQWQLTVEAEHGLVLFNHIDALVREMRLSALSEEKPCQLAWSLSKDEQTTVSCRLQSTAIDQALKEWGMERGVFAEEFEALIDSASWLGSPANFSFADSRVPFSISLKKGYFADVDSASTDALKALGFFNISNLVRRLKLDFKDLSQDGLTFDRVKGELLLEQGVMSSVSALQIKSSASEIKISGSGDFNRELLDVDMSVSLPLVSNLPWIVALAAGLPAAVGVFVVSKILGKQVDKLSTAIYHISGDMNQPKVKFKRLFDVEKNKKK